MFKPGEIAGVKGSERAVTVLPSSPEELRQYRDVRWPVKTSGGVFDETELSSAHPTVIATASGRDLSSEAFNHDLVALGVERGAAVNCMTYNLRDEVEEILKKASVDLNGHWKNGSAILEGFKPLENLFLSLNSLPRQDAEDLVSSKTPLDRWIPVDSGIGLTLRTCPCCGEEDFDVETNGTTVRISGAPCKFPNGLPPTEWELNVPSGRLVIANDLRRLFPLPEDEDFNINTARGCSQTALAYAANGMSHAFVGNTCPGVYACSDGGGTFKIANAPSDEEWNEKRKKFVKVKPAPVFDGGKVASICTDLWWYSIVDHAEFMLRCKRFKLKASDFNVEVVNVKPGVYRFRHDEESCRHEGSGECVFTRFAWVREPDPIKDFLANYELVDVNPNAYVQAQVARWPTLYGTGKKTPWADMTEEDRLHSWQRVADQVFCTIGGGVEWHEKGFPKAKVDPSTPDVEPPSFRAQHHWYPFSEPYGGLFEPKTLSSSFAKLAFRVLESVISFGTDVRDSEHSREVPYVRQRMLLAMKRYRELVKQYPDQADSEYVAWLSQKGRAEAWVENFPLGPEFTEKHKGHARRQRWVPEDAYAVEFDARKLEDGHFASHPKKGGCWANKGSAQRYALNEWSDNGQAGERNCFWAPQATNTSVPLYSVARVVKVGAVSHMGETLVEIAYDYGTPWMQNAEKRKALVERAEKAGIKILTRDEYERLLPGAIQFFDEVEASVGKKVAK